MKHINFIKCESDSQLKEVAGLANIIWHEYFPFLLSEDQINYMVEKFQSFQAMKDQIQNQNYTYYQIHLDDQLVGYMGLALESASLFISKNRLCGPMRFSDSIAAHLNFGVSNSGISVPTASFVNRGQTLDKNTLVGSEIIVPTHKEVFIRTKSIHQIFIPDKRSGIKNKLYLIFCHCY